MIQAFFIYNLLLLFLFVSWRLVTPGAGGAAPAPQNVYLARALVSVVLYALVLGFRYNVGGDYQGYVGYFKGVSGSVSSADVPYEIGFYWLIRALKFFQLPPSSLFLATCGIQMIFMTIWLRRHSFLASWFIYFYFTTLLAFESMNTIRQAMALMILLCAVLRLLDRKPLQYLVLVGLASTLHKSALIFLPLYFFLDKEWISSRRWQIVILLIAYASANAIKELLFDLLPQLSAALGYGNYADIQQDLFFGRQVQGFSPGLMFVLVSDLIVIMASPWLKRRYAALGFRAYYNAFYVGAVITPAVFFANYIPISRMAFYFLSFKFIVLSFLAAGLFTRPGPWRWSKVIGAGMVISYFGWFSLAIFKGAAWCAPFQFVFQ